MRERAKERDRERESESERDRERGRWKRGGEEERGQYRGPDKIRGSSLRVEKDRVKQHVTSPAHLVSHFTYKQKIENMFYNLVGLFFCPQETAGEKTTKKKP